ncbi:MAG: phosphoadenosine phosphosulfate reductase family protein [Thermoplasmata archaeon]|nr:phosphoadenosine phosphosulfate reductase family protein [Thermoplasmata archaeon]
MPAVIHGKMELKWCPSCCSPIIRGKGCPSCGGKIKRVEYTPPGDIRPAFPHDIKEAKELASKQWGEGAGDLIFGVHRPIVINPCPAPDRLDELIGGGEVLGSISFRTEALDHFLILRKGGGERLRSCGFKPSRGYVVADDSAIPFLLKSANLLSPGILDSHKDVIIGDEVLILTEDGRVLGSGNARKDASDMCGTKGMGVKIRWVLDLEHTEPEPSKVGADRDWISVWNRVIEVNRPLLDDLVRRSVSFIERTAESEGLPVAVSFSGGKDSLATLLLALDAGLRPPLIFIDTGIEFPETVRYVRDFAREYDLTLHEGHPDVSFFENFERFGPPGRDFRWCCKGCKLGPATNVIGENFPHGVLTLIGQRRYESDSRKKKGSVWNNPWVPLQRGASPVQNWTALDVWLYIFMRSAPYNVLYEKGFARIGCYLCPSVDLSEMYSLDVSELDTTQWKDALEKERADRGLPREWLEYGFHRFKKLPPHMRELARTLDMEKELLEPGRRRSFGGDPVVLVEGHRTCEYGISREGMIDPGVDWGTLINLLNIIGEVREITGTKGWEVLENGGSGKRSVLDIFSDGTLILKGRDEGEIDERERVVRSIAKRSTGCIGCGICVGRCPTGALRVDGKGRHVVIDTGRCTHCGSCLGPCPAESFIDDPFNS